MTSLSGSTNQRLQFCVQLLQHSHLSRVEPRTPPCPLREKCQLWTFCSFLWPGLALAYQPVSMDWIWSMFGSHRWIFCPQMSTNNRDCSDSSHTGPSPIRAFALITQSTLTEAIFTSKLNKSELVQESRTTKRSVTRSISRGRAATKTSG